MLTKLTHYVHGHFFLEQILFSTDPTKLTHCVHGHYFLEQSCFSLILTKLTHYVHGHKKLVRFNNLPDGTINIRVIAPFNSENAVYQLGIPWTIFGAIIAKLVETCRIYLCYKILFKIKN